VAQVMTPSAVPLADPAPSRSYGVGTRVALVGLGKIGLPLAAQYAARGMRVLGCDASPAVAAAVSEGRAHVREEPGLAELVADAVVKGRLSATTDTTRAVAAADVVVIIVPVVVDEVGNVDWRAMDAATDAVGRGLRPGTLVLYETTLPVGTTGGRLAARLRDASGLEAGRDFMLAFSPERVQSGTIFRDLASYPKVVGGVDRASTEAAVAFYEAALDFDPSLAAPRVRALASCEAAELTKLIECVYRDVNIALANQFARFADRWGVDLLEAIGAANSEPQSHVHQPGVGVGGHCIPVYPYFMINDERAGELLSLPRAARQVNDGMAAYAVECLADALGGIAGRTVLVLGYAYRGNVREHFLSSAKKLVVALEAAGADPVVHDPLYTPEELRRQGLTPYDLEAPTPVDAAVLQAVHAGYRQLDFRTLPGCRVVVDGRNALDRGRIEAAGLRYIGIGRGA
jgi:nucleotide sugar dehydrogenase